MASPIHGLIKFDFSVTGWNTILNTLIDQLDDLLDAYLLVTLGETVSQYDALYCHTDGKWYKATGLNGEVSPGLAMSDGVVDDEIQLRRRGTVTNSSWSWTIGSKNPVWLSPTTAGDLTQVRPATGAGEQCMGIPISATTILLVGISELEFLESSSSSSSRSSSSSSSSSSA